MFMLLCYQTKLLQIAEMEDSMINIGLIRKIDNLGRITLPKEFRKLYMIEDQDDIEIIATEEGIMLKKPNIEIKRK